MDLFEALHFMIHYMTDRKSLVKVNDLIWKALDVTIQWEGSCKHKAMLCSLHKDFDPSMVDEWLITRNQNAPWQMK